MDQHAGHAERVGDQAGVLTAGAAEAIERIAGHVVAALHRIFLIAFAMFSTAILMKPSAICSRSCAPRRSLRASLAKSARTASASSGSFCSGPEDLREEIGHELADHHIGVGHRQRTAAAVAFRPGIGAGRVGADPEARAVEMQDRAAAGGHRVDQHHRRAHAHAGDLGLEGALDIRRQNATRRSRCRPCRSR